MTEPYRAVLALDAAEDIYLLRAPSRRKILGLLRDLERNPFRKGEFPLRDSLGRDVEVVFLDDREVHWYVDYAEREVRVLMIGKVVL